MAAGAAAADRSARPGPWQGGSRRRLTYERGLAGEAWAALALRLKGYRILARRVRTPVGELDLIARRGRTLVFVEVKFRPTRGEAAESIGPRARERLARAAEAVLARYERAGDDMRLDAVLVSPTRWPQHVKGV